VEKSKEDVTSKKLKIKALEDEIRQHRAIGIEVQVSASCIAPAANLHARHGAREGRGVAALMGVYNARSRARVAP
jgi:hypothetical protein